MDLFRYDAASGRTSLDIIGYDDVEVGATHIAHDGNGHAPGNTIIVTLQRTDHHYSWGVLTSIEDEDIKTRDGSIQTLEIPILITTINAALRELLHPAFFRYSGPIR